MSIIAELVRALRATCPDCRLPEDTGTRRGYTCAEHRAVITEAVHADPAATL